MCRGSPSVSSTVRPAAMMDWASTWPPKTRPCGIGWLRPTKMSASESPRSDSSSSGLSTLMCAAPTVLRSRTSSRSSKGSSSAGSWVAVTSETISGGCDDGRMTERESTERPYRVDVPLRWSDMDAYGHVNNVQFLRLLEDARVIGFQEWFGQDRSMLDEGVLVARHEIEYLAPLEFRIAPIQVDMWATQISGASFDLAYEVRDPASVGDALYARAETTLVAYDFASAKPRRLRPKEREVLKGVSGEPVPFRWRQRART
jgi:acyl-CoA thioester hydrolase